MFQKYNKYRVLQALFDQPTTGLHLREVAREAQLAPYSTKRYLQELETEGLVTSRTERYGYPLYYANNDNQRYKLLRQYDVVLRLEESGLLDELEDHGATTIILFGSASRGEDVEESDIDLYVLGTTHELDLAPYEARLKRKINILFSKSFEKASQEFKNNLLNAIKLRGYLKVFANEPLPPRHARRPTSPTTLPPSSRNAPRQHLPRRA